MWSHLSQISSNPVSESSNGSVMTTNCFQLRAMQDAETSNTDSGRSKQLVFSGLGSAGCLKQDYQSPQTLFSDWPWKKELSSPAMEYRPSKDSNSNPDVNVDCCGSL